MLYNTLHQKNRAFNHFLIIHIQTQSTVVTKSNIASLKALDLTVR